jgi:uncharacterized protein
MPDDMAATDRELNGTGTLNDKRSGAPSTPVHEEKSPDSTRPEALKRNIDDLTTGTTSEKNGDLARGTTPETTDDLATIATPEKTDDPLTPDTSVKTDDTGNDMNEKDGGVPREEEGIFDELYTTLFGKSWEMWIGCIILSFLSIVLFLISSPWGSSGGLNNFGQNFYDMLGMSFDESAPKGVKEVRDYRYAMLSLTMLLGALGSALIAKEFAIRVPPKGELAKGLVGGVLMGTGAILGMGCTVGGFYSAWPALSGSGLIFALGLFIGVYIAVQYLVWEMEAYPGLSSGKTYTVLASRTTGMSLQPLAGMIVLGIGASLALLYDSTSEKVLIGFVLIGLIIGVVLQRSRFCIVRALREPFISGDSDPAVGIMAGIIIGLIGFTTIKVMGIGSESAYVASSYWVPAIVGGVIFGLGMTVAGGCTVGATWRAGEGHVKLWMALIGLILSMPLVGEYIKPGFFDMLPDSMNQAVFLPDTFGYGGSISLMLLIIVLWFIFVKWNERTGRLTAF